MLETLSDLDDLLPMVADVVGELHSSVPTLADRDLLDRLRTAEQLGRLADAARVGCDRARR